MKKRILAFLLTAALTLGLLPTAALAATPPWSGTDGGASGITVDTAPSAVKWALTISPKANGLASDSDVYAVVIPTDVYSAKPISFLTSINATNYSDASKLGLSAGDHRATTAKYVGGGAIPLPAMTLPSFTVQPATYHKQYTYILFSNRGTGDIKNYYTGTFWVDTEGNTGTRDASYMVRYNGNATSVGSSQPVSGTPGNVITKPESANTLLNFGGISRQGYTFLGWDTNKDLMGTVPNDAASSDIKPTYVAGSNPSFRPTDTSRGMNEIQDLHAIWKPVQVTIAAQAEAMSELRVGVSFTYIPILGGASGTTKKVSVGVGDNKWLADHGLSIKNNTITGVPTVWTAEGKDITLTVTDESNKTTATLVVALPRIEKGLQPQPDTSVITGLSATMVDDGDEETNDGRLIGFYAAGQPPKKDSADVSMTDGTGTYTDYYLTKGMVYEYRPKTADNTGAWRELPAPEALYSGLTPEQKTAFLTSLEAGATARYKTTITSKTAATCEALPDGEAWGDAYGTIIFDGGLPVVTGLVKDAEYEVRFRKSDAYDPSPAALITVGGSGGGSAGPADPSDFASITFYDWDETLLGAIVVAKGNDASVEVQAFTNARIANVSELDPKYLWYSDEKMEADKADPAKTPKYFSNKKGYDFDTWLLNDSATFTANDSALPAYDGTNDAAAAAAGIADFRNMTENLTVKAAYKGNTTLNATTYTDGTWSGRDSRYSFSASEYNRYGAAASDSAGIYAITVNTKRENLQGFGVTRATEPALRSSFVTDKGLTGSEVTIYLLTNMTGKDIEAVEIVPPKTVGKVSYAIIDSATTNSWPTAGAVSVSGGDNKNAGEIGSDGFVKFGTIKFINTQAKLVASEQSNNWAWVNAQAFKDAGLSTAGAGNLNTAKARLEAYFRKTPDALDLSHQQLQAVINGTL